MTKIKVRVEGHYEVEELPYGRDYRWVPAHALIECDCGRALDVHAGHTACPACGKDHAEVVRHLSERHLTEAALRPWRRDHAPQPAEHREDQEWEEQRSL